MQVTPEELVEDRCVPVSARVVAVAVVGVDPLVGGADPIEQGVAGLRRTHVVLKPDIHDDRTADAVGEVDAVEILDGLLDRGPPVGMPAQEDRAATIQDWKSGWVAESEESLETAWAPGLYAGLLWAAAPRLEAISVEYHYLRTGQVSRVRVSRDMAAETLAWARTTATMIGKSSARAASDLDAFPPRPGKACSTCPWVHRCPGGQAALEATGDNAVGDEVEAGRLAGLLLAGEATLIQAPGSP